jgi:hypothetical protein
VRAGRAPGNAGESRPACQRRAAALDAQVGKAVANARAVRFERRETTQRLDRERVLVLDLGRAAVRERGVAVPRREPARAEVVDALELGAGQGSSGTPSRDDDAWA